MSLDPLRLLGWGKKERKKGGRMSLPAFVQQVKWPDRGKKNCRKADSGPEGLCINTGIRREERARLCIQASSAAADVITPRQYQELLWGQ